MMSCEFDCVSVAQSIIPRPFDVSVITAFAAKATARSNEEAAQEVCLLYVLHLQNY